MGEFEFVCPTRIIVTHHLSKALASVKEYLGINRVMIMTDPGMAKLSQYRVLKMALEEAGLLFVEYTEVEPNPTNESVEAAAAVLRIANAQAVVGFGGGSSIDTCKAAAVLVANGEKLSDYYGVDKVQKKTLPIIAIPTTAGSGADVTRLLSMTDLELQTKVQISDASIAPAASIIYPENLMGTPQHLIAAVGFDSLTHAIEGFLNRKATPITEALSLKAFELMSRSLVDFYNDNMNVAKAEALQLGTTLGCMACSSIGTGDTHNIGRAVGGRYHHIHHGTALSVVLPHVLYFNMDVRAEKMAQLAVAMGLDTTGMTKQEAALYMILSVQKIRDNLGLPQSYRELGVSEDSFEEIAKAAMYNSENGSSAFAAPRKATMEEYLELIRDAYEGKKIKAEIEE